MKPIFRRCLIVFLFQVGAAGSAAPPAELAARARGVDILSRLPFTFHPSRGSVAAPEQFEAAGGGWTFHFDGRGFRLQLPDADAPLGMELVGSNVTPVLAGEAALAGKRNILLGPDPEHWRRNLPTFARVRARDVYPGIDLVCHGSAGRLEYDFLIAPGANPQQILLEVEGTAFAEAQADGSLVLCSGTQELIQRPPVVYQELDGERVPISGRFVLLDSRRFGFEIGAYNLAHELILDPVLLFSASLSNFLNDLETDAAGNCYAATGLDIDESEPIRGDYNLVKIDTRRAEVLYATRFQLRGSVTPGCLAVDADGHAYLAAQSDFAGNLVKNAPPNSDHHGGFDVYFAKLSPTGDDILFAGYLGGADDEMKPHVGIDSSRNVYLAGTTASASFPTTAGSFQRTLGGERDFFVTKISSGGEAVVYSTFLGGRDDESIVAMAVNANGQAYVVGNTGSVLFPTTPGAFRRVHPDPLITAICISGLNTAGGDLVYSTFFPSDLLDTFVKAAAISADGRIAIVGDTIALTLPTQNPFQRQLGGSNINRFDDAFLAVFDPALTGSDSLVYGSYLGGEAQDQAEAVAFGPSGDVYVAGTVLSSDFPVRGSMPRQFAGDSFDTFLARFRTSLDREGTLVECFIVGGDGAESKARVAIAGDDLVFLGCRTISSGLPRTACTVASPNGFGSFLAAFAAAAPMAALSLSLSAASSVQTCRDLTLTMTVRNDGPETSAGTVASLALPNNFEGAVISLDDECELDEASRTIHCRLCAVAMRPLPNRGVSVRVTLRPTAPEDLTFQASLTSISTDPDLDDNTDQVTVAVNGIPFPIFRRGDANDDGKTDISDGVRILNFLFIGGAVVLCPDAADANDDQAVNISDPSFIFSFLFLGGPPPPSPGSAPNPCCSDPTADDLGSCRYNSC